MRAAAAGGPWRRPFGGGRATSSFDGGGPDTERSGSGGGGSSGGGGGVGPSCTGVSGGEGSGGGAEARDRCAAMRQEAVTLQRAAAQKSDKLRRPRISLYPKRDQRMETRKAPAGGVGVGWDRMAWVGSMQGEGC